MNPETAQEVLRATCAKIAAGAASGPAIDFALLPRALPGLPAFWGATHITFGGDWQYAVKERSTRFAQLPDDLPWRAAQRQAIRPGKAEQLFARLAIHGAGW